MPSTPTHNLDPASRLPNSRPNPKREFPSRRDPSSRKPPKDVVDDRPASRLEGWGQDIDHTRHNAVVDADGFITWLLPPHVKGSINSPKGIRILPEQKVALVEGAITQNMEEMYAEGIAALDSNNRIVLVSGKAIGRYHKVESRKVDEQTSAGIKQGATYLGKTLSLSPNAIAKYTAAKMVAQTLTYPYTFSTLDNDDTLMISDAAEMYTCVDDVMVQYLVHLQAGVKAKSVIRGGGK